MTITLKFTLNTLGEKEKDPYSREEIQKIIDGSKPFSDLIEELLQKYKVSFIKLDDEIEIGKVCDIFTHINSKESP